MKSVNKIVSLILMLVIAVGAIASCTTPTVEQLQSDTYAANVEIKFSSNDDKMKDAIAAINNQETKIYVDGEDVKVETQATVGGFSVTNKYTYFGGTLYHEQNVSAEGKSSTTLERASLNEENRAQLLSDLGAGASIEPSDFNVQDIDGDEGNYTYTCSRITSKAKESLCDIFAAKFAGLDATVELNAVEFVLEMQNGRDEKSTLTCHFVIGMGGESYEITMEIVTDYDYDAMFGITVPANSSSYKQVLYSEIIK